MIEGEGSFVNRRGLITITLASTDFDVLERLVHVTGMGQISSQTWSKQPSHYKPRWSWQVSRTEHAYALTAAVFPWLLARRRQQAITAMTTFTTHKRALASERKEYWNAVV